MTSSRKCCRINEMGEGMSESYGMAPETMRCLSYEIPRISEAE